MNKLLLIVLLAFSSTFFAQTKIGKVTVYQDKSSVSLFFVDQQYLPLTEVEGFTLSSQEELTLFIQSLEAVIASARAGGSKKFNNGKYNLWASHRQVYIQDNEAPHYGYMFTSGKKAEKLVIHLKTIKLSK